jgi:hypothetical protein
VVVLSYGCIYQGGYVYAFNDTTSTSLSVGGKVASTVNQATQYSPGIIWSSNALGSTPTPQNTSVDEIPGIDEISTTTTGSPTYSAFSGFFASTYTNMNPFTSASFSQCNGALDGSCNTANILTFYNQFITNNNDLAGGTPLFTASAGPTPITYYAAGLCKQTISSYSDWYLPAICQMGYSSSGNTPCGTLASPTLQNMLSNLVNFNTLNLIAGTFWSSTQAVQNTPEQAWFQQFTNKFQSFFTKNGPAGVRCSRNLTLG